MICNRIILCNSLEVKRIDVTPQTAEVSYSFDIRTSHARILSQVSNGGIPSEIIDYLQ